MKATISGTLQINATISGTHQYQNNYFRYSKKLKPLLQGTQYKSSHYHRKAFKSKHLSMVSKWGYHSRSQTKSRTYTHTRHLNYVSNNEAAPSVYPGLVLIKLTRRKSAAVLRESSIIVLHHSVRCLPSKTKPELKYCQRSLKK